MQAMSFIIYLLYSKSNMLLDILNSKPVLVGLHLSFAIIGIDGFLWALGELVAGVKSRVRILFASILGLGGFILSWIFGGYYYVVYYGSLVKPAIKVGVAPWAHEIFMETKEHIFLFIIPLAITAILLILLGKNNLDKNNLRKVTIWLVSLIVAIALLIGIMGYIISAAARWG